MPRHTRFTLGIKIDTYFTESIECCLRGGYASKENKPPYLIQLSTNIDSLKFFLKLLWEVNGLSTSKYAALSKMIDEIGRMVGGWLQLLKKQLPHST